MFLASFICAFSLSKYLTLSEKGSCDTFVYIFRKIVQPKIDYEKSKVFFNSVNAQKCILT